MLMPKRMKFRKQFKGRMKGKATAGNTLSFGEFGLVATDKAKLTSRQIEAARIAVNRYLRRGGKLIIRIFPHKPITKRPAEVRMGKGKGPVEYYVAPVFENTIIFELSGVTEAQAREAFRLAGHKLPLKVKFIKKEVQELASQEATDEV